MNASSPQFLVTWSGSDSGSGLSRYDVQYRDGAGGNWTDWIINTTQTLRGFQGQLGHTYYFQTRARDRIGNVEGNRDQAIALAYPLTDPAALNTPPSDHRGNFNLYYNSTGIFSLTISRRGFGALPPMMNLTVSDTSASPIVYLPSGDEQIIDGQFERGDFSAWRALGEVTPTITTTAHTGAYGAALGGVVPSGTVTGLHRSTIEQTINLSPAIISGTLSLLYQVVSADPMSDTLKAYLMSPSDTLTFTLPLTTSGWAHHWLDVSAWTVPTATLRIELVQGEPPDRAAAVIVDEVSLGSFMPASYPSYLPIMPR